MKLKFNFCGQVYIYFINRIYITMATKAPKRPKYGVNTSNLKH